MNFEVITDFKNPFYIPNCLNMSIHETEKWSTPIWYFHLGGGRNFLRNVDKLLPDYTCNDVVGLCSDNALDLYSKCARFESPTRHQLSRVFRDIPQSLQADVGVVSLLSYDHFLVKPFQLIFYATIKHYID
jgi:hypothetical protein